jgi:glycosyltransferase involved in cell wall biosynthesis
MNNRILILSDVNSSHTQKWCIALSLSGHNIGIFSLTSSKDAWHEKYQNIKIFYGASFSDNLFYSSSINKLKYLTTLSQLKGIIREFNPSILHAHYATSYGLLGALTGFHPFLISAWGTDIMEFPYKSWFHRWIIKYNFKKCDQILATSNVLANHAKKFTRKKIKNIPFGVELQKFVQKKVESIFSKNDVVIGVVKSMEEIYGIDLVIKAFEILTNKYPNLNLKLLLVGSGSRAEEYKQLVKKLNIESKTIFTGRISHDQLANYYNMIDIFVNFSHNESFGVSVLEASSCELAVVVSKVGGLMEVVEENKTGLFVEAGNINSLCNALERLIHSVELRNKMGKAGREFVKKNYDWSISVREMKNVYNTFLKLD